MVEINEKIASHEKLINKWEPRAKELKALEAKKQFRFMINGLKRNIQYLKKQIHNQ